MSDVFALDKHNNYVPTMTREEIIAAIQTAAAGGSLEGFDNCAVVSQIKELNKNAAFSVWVGTQAEYNAISNKQSNVLYLISDDPMNRDLPNMVENLRIMIVEYDKIFQRQNESLSTLLTRLNGHENAINLQGAQVIAHDEQLAAHDEQLQGLSSVGYTALYNGLEENYTTLSGIAIAENYDAFDFLIFEFEEIANDTSVAWRARAMMPTLELKGITNYGIYLTFYQTEGRTTVRFDADNKKRLYFYGEGGADMKLAAIYGYIRKGGA